MVSKPSPRSSTRRAGQGRRDLAPAAVSASASASASAGGARAGRREARGEQFLDVAAELIRERGLGGLTMERLAEAAGVSKALPYRYFDNADAVFVALHLRETGALSERIAGAIINRAPGEDIIKVAVHAYFDAVVERGDLLIALAGAGSPIPAIVEQTVPQTNTLADLFTQAYGVKGKRAIALSAVVQGAVVGASDAMGRGEISRAMAEKVAITALSAGVRAVAAE